MAKKAKKYYVQVWKTLSVTDLDGNQVKYPQWVEMPLPFDNKPDAMRFVEECESEGKRCRLVQRG